MLSCWLDDGAVAGNMWSLETLVLTLGLVFLIALCGTVVGLLQVRPWGGRGWEWKRARLLIASVAVLVVAVAYAVVACNAIANTGY